MGIVDWDELPPDIIESISKRLTVYADYLRFRAVCRNWCSFLPKTPLHLPPQQPFLMFSQTTFFDLSNHQTHILNFPPQQPSHRTRNCGSSHGWLILLDETPEIRLLNPFTRATRLLPPLYTFPNVVSFSYSNVGREYLVRNSHAGAVSAFNLRQMCNSFIKKAILSSSPSRSDEFVAFAIVGEHNLAFCKNGDDSWVFISEEALYCWEDAVYQNGLFYAVSKGGSIAVCDVEGSNSPQISFIHSSVPLQFAGDIHYTVFSGDEMLLVTRILEQEFGDEAGGDYSNLVYRTVGFDVFKMNWSSVMWQKIETLGDRVLFIGGNSSISLHASDFVGCLGDCIYFTDDYSESNYDDDAYGIHDLGIFCLWNKSIEPLPCYPRNSYSRLGWPLPIWLSPNPC